MRRERKGSYVEHPPIEIEAFIKLSPVKTEAKLVEPRQQLHQSRPSSEPKRSGELRC